ncbi:hypothetical protein LCGC14_1916730 [marine sediment metagenome]|uniref:Uncharacterized protein n=1 Tax=marine sediment metagenome TaxID=412755 RepID=A0A0F9I5Y2_9ZZZZ
MEQDQVLRRKSQLWRGTTERCSLRRLRQDNDRRKIARESRIRLSSRDSPGRWDPYGSGHIVLRSKVPCKGCLLENCKTIVINA